MEGLKSFIKTYDIKFSNLTPNTTDTDAKQIIKIPSLNN